jgi:hypothetical protein
VNKPFVLKHLTLPELLNSLQNWGLFFCSIDENYLILYLYFINMQVFTSSLPDTLFEALSNKASELKVPKNKLIEKALMLYLEQLNKAAYIKSYRQMSEDTDVLQLAEEGMQAYYAQLNGLDQDETR